MNFTYLKHNKISNRSFLLKNHKKNKNVSLQKVSDNKSLITDRRKYLYILLSTSYVLVDSLFQDDVYAITMSNFFVIKIIQNK